MITNRSAYRAAVALAVATPLFLVWAIGALGVIGRGGDRADLMYVGVLVVEIVGVAMARLKPDGMAQALVATAVAQGLVALIALLVGKHHDPVTSVAEILGVNGMFVALFVASAWLFRRASGGAIGEPAVQ